jgi:hypothetical protein
MIQIWTERLTFWGDIRPLSVLSYVGATNAVSIAAEPEVHEAIVDL